MKPKIFFGNFDIYIYYTGCIREPKGVINLFLSKLAEHYLYFVCLVPLFS